jgi:GT2 family glycosyltransferase
MIETSIIIANYNGKRFLKGCIESLQKLDYPKEKLEVIMVDNLSSDDSVSYVRKNYPDVKLIVNDANNYCRANNIGIKRSSARKYAVLLNNDTIVDRMWLKELVKTAESDKRIGCVGSKILFMKGGRIQSVGHEYIGHYYWKDRGFDEVDKGQYDKEEEVESLCGASLLIKKECIEDVGLLDENFGMYLEDVDFAIRCRKKGWKLAYNPKSIVHHYFRGTSTPRLTEEYYEKNRLMLIMKHFPQELGGELRFYVEKVRKNAWLKSKGFHTHKHNKNLAKKEQELQKAYQKIRYIANARFSLTARVEKLEKHMKEQEEKHKEAIKRLGRERDEKQKQAFETQYSDLVQRNKLLESQLAVITQKELDAKSRLRQKEDQLRKIFNSRGWKFLTTIHHIKRIGKIK